MTVKEYREKYPNCRYCRHRLNGLDTCSATDQKMSKRTAKKCPCYEPDKWYLDDKTINTNPITLAVESAQQKLNNFCGCKNI